MAERRLIDANALRKKAVPHTRGEHGYSADIRKWAVLVGDIDDAPTIDAVEVVRCKDCTYAKNNYLVNGLCLCQKPVFNAGDNDEKPINIVMGADEFCSHGERRGDNGHW